MMAEPDAFEPDLLERPLYLLSEAAHIAGTTAAALARWISPYKEERHYAAPREAEPLIITPPRWDGERTLSFLNLIEARLVVQYRGLSVSLEAIRKAANYAREEFGDLHPLRTRRFVTDGVGLFQRVQEAEGVLGLVSFSGRGQLAWPEAIESFLQSIDFDEYERAVRWWLRGRGRLVLVDPRYAFGQPVVAERYIRTEILVERFEVGEDVEEVAEDFRISKEAVEEAIRFELTRAA